MIPRAVLDDISETIFDNILSNFPLVASLYPHNYLNNAGVLRTSKSNYYNFIASFMLFSTNADIIRNQKNLKMCYQLDTINDDFIEASNRLNQKVELFYKVRQTAHREINLSLRDVLLDKYGKEYHLADMKIPAPTLQFYIMPAILESDENGYIDVEIDFSIEFYAVPITTELDNLKSQIM